jgi:hypothetical protein
MLTRPKFIRHTDIHIDILTDKNIDIHILIIFYNNIKRTTDIGNP